MTGISFSDARGPDGIVIYAIGDVHGRLDLMTRMHETIARDIDHHGRDWRIVHLGDYVDRGRDSAGVIGFLISRSAESGGRVVSLAGNHDTGFLDFLALPDPEGLFARYGGVETARSYGVVLEPEDPSAFRAGARALADAVPASHRAFLGGLAFSAAFGDFFFCHAGIRPGVALEAQDHLDLIWIRGEFHRHEGLYQKVIVHGHTPVAQAQILPNRVNVDTGAYATGRLTALAIDGAQKRLLTAE
ncbi:MAG: serine/threonine protein phosphatase [Mesorhizobium sp.]|nr:metallophosphoesterase [Mesorhizobium sp.]MBL8580152.1 serine/threonine protein phosphatase [Mesorhizobium sp.]